MAINDPKKSIKEVNQELGYLEDQLISIADSLSGSIREAMRDIREESQGVSQIFANSLSRSIKDIARGSEAILANTLKLATGSAKLADIQKVQQGLQLKQLAAQRNLNTLYNQGLLTIEEKVKAEQEITDSIKRQNVLLSDQKEYAQEIQKNLGLTGGILKGIAKIPVLGNFIDAEAALIAAQKTAATEGANRVKVMSSAFKQLGSSLKTNLSDPLFSIGLAVKLFQTLFKIGTEFSSRTFDIQKTLGLSTAQASAMNREFYVMQQTTDNIYANYKDLVRANFNLNEALGTSATFNADVLAQQAKIMEVTGLTAEESAKIYEYSLITGKSQEQVYNSIGKTNKGVLSNKKVMQEVLKTSGQLAAQYKNNPELLGKAVVQAQKLGITLQQAKNISQNLLNFEDSISAELEAELLTGRELNLERARALALQGKSAEAATELLNQTGGLVRFQEMNVLQQESLAKAMGMSTDELADSLVKAEKLNKLGGQEKRLLDEKISALKKAGEYEKASQLETMVLQGKKVELAAQELDTQGKIDKSISSIKESLKSAIAGPLASITDKLTSVLELMARNPVIKSLLGIAGGAAAVLAGVVAGAMAINAAKTALFGGRGSSIGRPMYTKDVGSLGGGGGAGDLLDGASESLSGGRKASVGKQIKTLFRNPKVMGRALTRLGGGSLVKGLLKGAGKTLVKGGGGIASLLGGFALDAVTANQMAKAEKLQAEGKKEEAERAKSIGKATDVGSAALTGAGLGATIGSIVPGLGTGIGAGVGGLLGAGYGAYQNYFADADTAEDFILRPGQKPLKFRKDDIVIGGTGLRGGSNNGAENSNVEALLRELISAVKAGGNIYIGPHKLNEAIGLNLHSIS